MMQLKKQYKFFQIKIALSPENGNREWNMPRSSYIRMLKNYVFEISLQGVVQPRDLAPPGEAARDGVDVRIVFVNEIFHAKISAAKKACRYSLIEYCVPRQSSRCLYEDGEFNVRAEGEDGKTASAEYKQFDCLGTYDTLSEIGKRKHKFVCRGEEVNLRLIVLRTCTCRIISHVHRNKLDVAERGEGGPGDEGPGRRSRGVRPLPTV